MIRRLSAQPWVRRVLRHVPPRLFAKFLSIGFVNTIFGYGNFALLTYLFSRRYPAYGFVVAGVISPFLNITFSFLAYKWFVFRTRGNYLAEWIRTFAVYGTSALIGAALLPIIVIVLRATTPMYQSAPYGAAALLFFVTTAFNFYALKEFSFKRKQSPGSNV
jgi:putative flippase GtrA